MILIGITGRARCGKDTAADYLSANIGFKKYSFAKPIKDAVKDMFGLTEDHVNGYLKEVVLPDICHSPRFLMQTLGTEWGRKIVND
jgi:dephospho-CoA kinase